MRAAVAWGLLLLVVPLGGRTGELQNYFPLDSPSYGYEIDEFQAAWYSEYLAALDEPSLWKLAQDGPEMQYRFLWLRSFHAPVSVRILIRSQRSADLYLKVADGAGGYSPGQLVENRVISLTPTDIGRVMRAITHADFWKMIRDRDDCGDPLPAVESSDVDTICITTDGARWILEGADRGQYHVVSQYSPGDGEFRDLCLLLLQLARYSPGPIY